MAFFDSFIFFPLFRTFKCRSEKEMVSLGDAAISLHILQVQPCLGQSNSKCQDLPKFEWFFWVGVFCTS